MLTLKRTDSSSQDFIDLVKLLTADLAIRDGTAHEFYNQFNSIANLKHVIVGYHLNQPVGCGAIKEFGTDAMEIKRMFVLPECRGKSIATSIIYELELWALELEKLKCVLETGINQPEAIALYKKIGYQQIANYDQYAGIDNSLCFEKVLS